VFKDDGKLIERMAPALQRVLVIDPSPPGGRMLADLMRSLVHCQVWIAPSAGKAMELLKGIDPQIVFIEHAERGGVDGIEFTRACRARPAGQNTPIIVLTTENGAEIKAEGRRAGASAWMVKPFEPNTLLGLVARYQN